MMSNDSCKWLFVLLVVISTGYVVYSWYYFSENVRSAHRRSLFGVHALVPSDTQSTVQWQQSTVPLHTAASNSSEIQPRKSYMLSLVYAEQLTNAFSHFNEFLILVSRWNMTGVEPYIKDSRMYGFQTLNDKPSFKLGLLFDMKSFQSNFSKCQQGKDINNKTTDIIAPMDSFLKHSQRKLAVVYFSNHMFVVNRDIHKAMDSYLEGVFLKHPNEPIVLCTNVANKSNLVSSVEDVLKKEQELGMDQVSSDDRFSVEQVFCVNRKVSMSLVQLMEHLKRYLNSIGSRASLLFLSWQGKFTRQFTDLETIGNGHCLLPFTQIPLSKDVHIYADKFIQSQGFTEKEFISVHIRFEKLFEFAYTYRTANKGSYYKCCMERLQVLLEDLMEINNVSFDHILLLIDYGTFGSDSCRYDGKWSPKSVCLEQTNKSLAMLNISTSGFQPKAFKGAPINSGFVSLVEEASLLRGKLLITVGAGGFQNGVRNRFSESHSDVNAHSENYHICINEKLHGLKLDSKEC